VNTGSNIGGGRSGLSSKICMCAYTYTN
jgi:hypothetical protein